MTVSSQPSQVDEWHPLVDAGLPAGAGPRRDAGDGRTLAHVADDEIGQVPHGREIHGHGIEVREPTTGKARTVEQGVDRATDGVDGTGDGVRVPEVHRVVAGHPDGRLLQVEHVDLGAEVGQLAHGRCAHAGPSPAADHDPHALVAPH